MPATVRRFLHFARLPRARQGLAVECACALLRAFWQVRRWPFARLASSLGPVSQPLRDDLPQSASCGDDATACDALRAAREVRWAVAAVVRASPLTLTCLMQAVAARRVLQRRGIASQLVFGVRAGAAPAARADSDLSAHAWLRCGPLLVTGAREAACFQPIAVYGAIPPAAEARG